MTDPWGASSAEYDAHVTNEARLNEARRQAVAELLVSRGHDRAAALVAISGFERVEVDGWNGGQYEVYLSLPAAQFDLVTDEVKDVIDAAASAVVGASCYQGLNVHVRLTDAADGWDRALIERLRDGNPHRQNSPLAPKPFS